MGFAVTVAAPPGELARFEGACAKVEGFAAPANFGTKAYVVVSTQGAGDRAALAAAARMQSHYRSFVGSKRKAETLRHELAAEGVPPAGLAAIKAPAGLNISAITSEEIALSILAEMVAARRSAQLIPADGPQNSGGPSP